MKDSYLINFDLFCLKRKFSLLIYLTTNKNVTYKNFCELMRSKSVTPPDVVYFNKIKTRADSLSLNANAEAVKLKEETEVSVDSKEIKEKPKPKRKRKSRKKAEVVNDNIWQRSRLLENV